MSNLIFFRSKRQFKWRPFRLLLVAAMGLSFSGGWSQSGLLGGTGTVQLGAGFDGNVWRIPVQAAHPFSASQSDGFTALQAQWNRDAVRGVNHWVLHASGFAKKHAVQSGANAHRVEFGAKLLHRLNERVRGDLGMLLVEKQQLEVHWEDNEQWSSMGRMDVQSFACMNFELSPRIQSDLGVTWRRSAYHRKSPAYSNESFKLHAAWKLLLLRRARGLRRFDLVNPQRTLEAGAVHVRVQFSQRNFDDWRVSRSDVIWTKNPLIPEVSLDPMSSMPNRVWVDWQVEGRYISPSNQGWNVYFDASWNRRLDESLGDFGGSMLAAGAGVQCHSNLLKLEMGLSRRHQQFERRFAWTEQGIQNLRYHMTAWNLDVEIPTVRGWSWFAQSAGCMRQSNHTGASIGNRHNMNFQSLVIGIRWHVGYRRFLMG